jgi:hypothetical protein
LNLQRIASKAIASSVGLQESEMGGLQGILSQATVYLPTAPSGLEPEVFAFKERDVANYTTGQNLKYWMPEQGLNLHFSVQSAATCH